MRRFVSILKFYCRNLANVNKASRDMGWNKIETIRKARKSIRDNKITEDFYFSEQLYKLSPEEQHDRIITKQRRRKRKKYFVQAVASLAGWDEEYAKRQMEKARKEQGVDYFVYYRFNCWEKTPEEQKLEMEKYRERRQRKANKEREEKELAIKNVMSYAGVSEKEAAKIIAESVDKTQCKYEEYNEFEMFKYPMEVQEQLFLKNFSDKLSLKYETDFTLSRLLSDKEASNKKFSKYIRRPWCLNRDISFEEFRKTFEGVSKIFYKPQNLQGGVGAVPFDINSNNMKTVYDEIITYEPGVVEKYIVQHHRMNELSPTAVNTIRFATIYSDSEPVNKAGDHAVIAYAVQKMGGANSVVDNLHQGGVAAIIDVATGKICTDGIDMYGNIQKTHPVTGTAIKGFEIPYFEEAKKMVFEMIKEFHMVGYLGWDVCIEEDGPTVIEVNGRPGVNLPTHPWLVTEQRGIKQEMAQYL